jgi:hypothetical protein
MILGSKMRGIGEGRLQEKRREGQGQGKAELVIAGGNWSAMLLRLSEDPQKSHLNTVLFTG